MSRKLGSKLDKPDSPELKRAMPDKPTGLSERAARRWDQLVSEMERSGIALIPAFRASIQQAATIQADLDVAWDHIRTHGRYTVSKTGVEKLSAAVDDTAKLNEKLSRCLWQLGLTPRSVCLTATPAVTPERTLDDILNAPTPAADGNVYVVDGDES